MATKPTGRRQAPADKKGATGGGAPSADEVGQQEQSQGGESEAAPQDENVTADPAANAEQAQQPAADDLNQPPDAPAQDPADPDAARDQECPDSVELAAPHGFIDDDGRHRFWDAGTIVREIEEIKLLILRKAHLVGIIHEE